MQIQELQVTQFKNIKSKYCAFHSKYTVIIGDNGVGKTNLLDAIHVQALCRSMVAFHDGQLCQHDTDFYRLESKFIKDENKTLHVETKFQQSLKKRTVSCNGLPYKRLIEHIGQIPLVSITPDDIYLIKGQSELRRKFIDVLLSQCDKVYLQSLSQYLKLLEQRNAYLKQCNGVLPSRQWLDIVDTQMLHWATYIFDNRKTFLEILPILFNDYYQQLHNSNDKIHIEYESDLLNNNLIELFLLQTQSDVAAGRTTKGLHKDEIRFEMQQNEVRKIASQGQMKSVLIALKLAEAAFLLQKNGTPPILLLDDIFDKLDIKRMKNLLLLLHSLPYQCIITDAHLHRIPNLLKELNFDYISIELP